MDRVGDGLLPWRLAGGVIALLAAVVVTVGSTNAAFTATQPISGLLQSGKVELSAGGVSSLTFGGANLAAIGPGTSLTESVTVTNSSTVSLPTEYTEIALWADASGAPADAAGLGGALVVQITRAIGGATPVTIYSGSFSGLATYHAFSTPIGSLWRSRNSGTLTGTEGKRAVYTFTISLPESATEGAASTAGITLVFEARNTTQ